MMVDKNIRLLDSQFAGFLAKRSHLAEKEQDQFQELIFRLSVALADGNSCLPVTTVEEDLVVRSGMEGDGDKPLHIFKNCLYLQRYFEHEKSLAINISTLCASSLELLAEKSLLDALFVSDKSEETDWQKVAAERALQQNFLIVSGGPGTGKTTTVVKILALLQSASGKQLRIALAAPTGKAAKRLQDSINSSVRKLAVPESIKESIPNTASTLHRLLGVKRHSPFFHHNAKNPLFFDLVVIDEASMVDLALMAKLVDALQPGSRLILLGDKDQLASVESGTVLADMIGSLPGNTVELLKSYRFDEGIKRFAQSINSGDAASAWELMADKSPENVSLLAGDVAEYGGKMYCKYMETVCAAKTHDDYQGLFLVFHSFKILCALRHGPAGVSGINRAVEKYLSQKGHDCFGTDWYPGRPVMLTRNEYGLDLYNGDMGICLPDPENPDSVKVWFERADGSLQGVLPGRLGSCETVFALTIHKSQGTEVGEVLVVLPEKESGLVTRELLYTAVTRARECVKVSSTRFVFTSAVTGKIERHSKLRQRFIEI
jgi:exodeoxyribonuclease V alpha subunit